MTAAKRKSEANYFINERGEEAMRKLLAAFEEGKTLKDIGDMFGVSYERARQWRKAFLVKLTVYQFHPEVKYILNEPEAA